MALSLAQAALNTQNELQRGVMETFVQESSVLDRVPLEPIEGNAYAYNEEATLPGIEFRAVNAAYSESTGTINQKTEALVILGGDADVDTFLVATRGNLNDLRAQQTRLKVKAASYKYQDAFVNGDVAVDANSFDGLKKRLTGSQVISMGTNGAAILTDAATMHAFFDKLDELLALVPGASALYMNSLIRSKIMSAMRRLNIAIDRLAIRKSFLTTACLFWILRDTLRRVRKIIPQTETQGSSEVASSIYAVRFGESPEDGGVLGLSNGGVQVRDLGEIDAKPVYRTRIEFFCGLGVFSGKAAARLQGVLNS